MTAKTKKAGLIVTFYGRRDKMLPLQKAVGIAVNLVKAHGDHADMSDEDKKTFLYRFDPPLARDTTIVQLALSEHDDSKPDDAQTVWQKKRRELQTGELSRILEEQVAQKDEEGRSIFWGYSLLYYATLTDGALDEPTQKELFQLAIRPKSNAQAASPNGQKVEVQPLATSNLKDVELWLMDVPDEGEGAKAAMVYIAWLPPDGEPELMTNVLYGKAAALLMPDLIAHKAYNQRRQYVLSSEDGNPTPITLYKERIEQLRDTIGPFLGFDNQSGNQPKDFSALKFKYVQLRYVTSLLDAPRLSLAQQRSNYSWWETQLGTGDLADYHKKQIEIALEELTLLLDKGQRMLEVAQTTIEMQQTELSQAQEERENLIAALMTILGVALAVSQLIDPSAAQALLDTFTYLFGISLPADNRLLQLLVQFLITGLLTGIAFLCYQRWRLKRRA